MLPCAAPSSFAQILNDGWVLPERQRVTVLAETPAFLQSAVTDNPACSASFTIRSYVSVVIIAFTCNYVYYVEKMLDTQEF